LNIATKLQEKVDALVCDAGFAVHFF